LLPLVDDAFQQRDAVGRWCGDGNRSDIGIDVDEINSNARTEGDALNRFAPVPAPWRPHESINALAGPVGRPPMVLDFGAAGTVASAQVRT